MCVCVTSWKKKLFNCFGDPVSLAVRNPPFLGSNWCGFPLFGTSGLRIRLIATAIC